MINKKFWKKKLFDAWTNYDTVILTDKDCKELFDLIT